MGLLSVVGMTEGFKIRFWQTTSTPLVLYSGWTWEVVHPDGRNRTGFAWTQLEARAAAYEAAVSIDLELASR